MAKQLILSSHYFPCIAYFILMKKYKKCILDLGENFEKQSYRNRCSIYSSQGKLDLIIPLINLSKNSMKNVLIDSKYDWKKNHWKSICAAYNSSPFFEYYSKELKDVFFVKKNKLYEFNNYLLKHICNEIGLKINIEECKTYIKESNNQIDYRKIIHPKKKIKDSYTCPKYIQTFESKHGYIRNLSILDLLFNEGPESIVYINQVY